MNEVKYLSNRKYSKGAAHEIKNTAYPAGTGPGLVGLLPVNHGLGRGRCAGQGNRGAPDKGRSQRVPEAGKGRSLAAGLG